MIILISGKAGVGKTTVANTFAKVLQENKKSFLVVSFAGKVKEIARDCFGWNGKKDEKGRKLLQNIGNTGRQYDPDIWAKYVVNNFILMESIDFFIIDDWRFSNELEYLKEFSKVVTIQIVAPERETLKCTPEYDDISENSLPDSLAYYDFIIYNTNLSMNDLKSTVEYIYSLVKERK